MGCTSSKNIEAGNTPKLPRGNTELSESSERITKEPVQSNDGKPDESCLDTKEQVFAAEVDNTSQTHSPASHSSEQRLSMGNMVCETSENAQNTTDTDNNHPKSERKLKKDTSSRTTSATSMMNSHEQTPRKFNDVDLFDLHNDRNTIYTDPNITASANILAHLQYSGSNGFQLSTVSSGLPRPKCMIFDCSPSKKNNSIVLDGTTFDNTQQTPLLAPLSSLKLLSNQNPSQRNNLEPSRASDSRNHAYPARSAHTSLHSDYIDDNLDVYTSFTRDYDNAKKSSKKRRVKNNFISHNDPVCTPSNTVLAPIAEPKSFASRNSSLLSPQGLARLGSFSEAPTLDVENSALPPITLTSKVYVDQDKKINQYILTKRLAQHPTTTPYCKIYLYEDTSAPPGQPRTRIIRRYNRHALQRCTYVRQNNSQILNVHAIPSSNNPNLKLTNHSIPQHNSHPHFSNPTQTINFSINAQGDSDTSRYYNNVIPANSTSGNHFCIAHDSISLAGSGTISLPFSSHSHNSLSCSDMGPQLHYSPYHLQAKLQSLTEPPHDYHSDSALDESYPPRVAYRIMSHASRPGNEPRPTLTLYDHLLYELEVLKYIHNSRNDKLHFINRCYDIIDDMNHPYIYVVCEGPHFNTISDFDPVLCSVSPSSLKTENQIRPFFSQLLITLIALREIGVIHNNIQPGSVYIAANVMRTPRGVHPQTSNPAPQLIYRDEIRLDFFAHAIVLPWLHSSRHLTASTFSRTETSLTDFDHPFLSPVHTLSSPALQPHHLTSHQFFSPSLRSPSQFGRNPTQIGFVDFKIAQIDTYSGNFDLSNHCITTHPHSHARSNGFNAEESTKTNACGSTLISQSPWQHRQQQLPLQPVLRGNMLSTPNTNVTYGFDSMLSASNHIGGDDLNSVSSREHRSPLPPTSPHCQHHGIQSLVCTCAYHHPQPLTSPPLQLQRNPSHQSHMEPSEFSIDPDSQDFAGMTLMPPPSLHRGPVAHHCMPLESISSTSQLVFGIPLEDSEYSEILEQYETHSIDKGLLVTPLQSLKNISAINQQRGIDPTVAAGSGSVLSPAEYNRQLVIRGPRAKGGDYHINKQLRIVKAFDDMENSLFNPELDLTPTIVTPVQHSSLQPVLSPHSSVNKDHYSSSPIMSALKGLNTGTTPAHIRPSINVLSQSQSPSIFPSGRMNDGNHAIYPNPTVIVPHVPPLQLDSSSNTVFSEGCEPNQRHASLPSRSSSLYQPQQQIQTSIGKHASIHSNSSEQCHDLSLGALHYPPPQILPPSGHLSNSVKSANHSYATQQYLRALASQQVLSTPFAVTPTTFHNEWYPLGMVDTTPLSPYFCMPEATLWYLRTYYPAHSQALNEHWDRMRQRHDVRYKKKKYPYNLKNNNFHNYKYNGFDNDLWCIAVIIYISVVGTVPFMRHGANSSQTILNTVQQIVEFMFPPDLLDRVQAGLPFTLTTSATGRSHIPGSRRTLDFSSKHMPLFPSDEFRSLLNWMLAIDAEDRPTLDMIIYHKWTLNDGSAVTQNESFEDFYHAIPDNGSRRLSNPESNNMALINHDHEFVLM